MDPAGDVASGSTTEPSVEPIETVEAPSEPAAIMLALDTSLSMQAEDAEPNRFGAAEAALDAFLDEAPAEVYIGLVSFHGIATLEVAPTTDRALVRSAIENLELDEATALGEAIFVSIESLDSFVAEHQGEAPARRILLLSDGETTVGRPDAAAVSQAKQAGIAVSTILIGTDEGVIRVPDSELPIPVPINNTSLVEIANATGGEFWEATTTTDLIGIFTFIARDLDN